MRCVSFCTAANYKLSLLADFFRSKRYIAKLFSNVLYVTQQDKPTDIFFFNFFNFISTFKAIITSIILVHDADS